MAFTRATPEADAALQASFPQPLSQIRHGASGFARARSSSPRCRSRWAEHPALAGKCAQLRGFRSLLFVPLLRDGTTDRHDHASRARRPARFADHHVQLLQTFADQAVIAIENVAAVRRGAGEHARSHGIAAAADRHRRRAESHQQLAGRAGAVFQAMLENATRICEAKFGTLYLSEGDGFRAAAMHNAPPAYEEARGGGSGSTPLYKPLRAAKTKQAVQIADVTLERGYIERDPFPVSAVDLGGYRSILSVPMLQEDKVIGVITSIARRCSRSPTSRSSCRELRQTGGHCHRKYAAAQGIAPTHRT